MTRRDHLAIGGAALGLALLAALVLPGHLGGLSIDALFWLRDRSFGPRHEPADSPAVILAIDEETYRRPPFAETPQVLWTPELAGVVEGVLAAGARIVGFDVVYPASVESRLPGFDRPLLRALNRGAREGRILLGRVQHQEKPIEPFPAYAIAAGRGANIRALNLVEDADGIVRRAPLAFRLQRADGSAATESAFAAELATRAGWRSGGADTLLLNFDGGAGEIPIHSLADIHACLAAGRTDFLEKQFRDRIVLLGTVLDVEDRKLASNRLITQPEGRGLADRCVHPVMTGLYSAELRRDSIPGVVVHAVAVNNLLRGDGLRLAHRAWTGVAALTMAGLVGCLCLMLSPWAAAAGLLAAMGAWTAIATVAFHQGLVLPLFQAALAGGAAFPLLMVYRFLVTDRDRLRVSRAFGLYLPKPAIDRMLADGRLPELGGELRDVSVLFSDIAGFTSLSERRGPAQLVEDLNQYFDAMSEIVERHGGFVDKFIGDAVVAVFGAPLDDPRHAEHAVLAALEMRQVLYEGAGRFSLGDGAPIRARVGVNTGPVLIGNIGGPRRFNYTVMGDTVNLASRLEGTNKAYGTQVMVSGETAAACGDAIRFREVDLARVSGRREPVRLLEPLGPGAPETGPFDAALGLWRAGRFAEAAQAFAALAGDPVAAGFVRRAEAFMAKPPMEWQGVTNLTEK